MELVIQLKGNPGAGIRDWPFSRIPNPESRVPILFAHFPDALRRAIERSLMRATALLERAVVANALAPFGTYAGAPLGELARSVSREVYHDDGHSVGRVFLGAPADQYGIFVETGTRPHFPPPAALEGWVRRRLGVTDDRQVREVAFLIGRKISRSGTPGRFLFERALEDNVDRVVGIFEEEVANAVRGE